MIVIARAQGRQYYNHSLKGRQYVVGRGLMDSVIGLYNNPMANTLAKQTAMMLAPSVASYAVKKTAHYITDKIFSRKPPAVHRQPVRISPSAIPTPNQPSILNDVVSAVPKEVRDVLSEKSQDFINNMSLSSRMAGSGVKRGRKSRKH